jgi:hypothetical protein
MTYKFKVGDKVKIINAGSGFPPSQIGKIATITETGYYDNFPGYRIKEKYEGNPKRGYFDKFVSELSFELVPNFEYIPPKYEKGSIVYINSSPLFISSFVATDITKICSFYRIKFKKISSPISLTQETLLYVKNNEYIMTDINGRREHHRMYFIEENHLDKKQRLSTDKIINNIENILNNIK